MYQSGNGRGRGKRGGELATRPRKYSIPRGTVNRETTLRFINSFVHEDKEGVRRIDGNPIKESDSRAIYRWKEEGACPLWHRFDGFLCRHDWNWTLFEIWVELEGLDLWEDKAPLDWEVF